LYCFYGYSQWHLRIQNGNVNWFPVHFTLKINLVTHKRAQ
jgi:hypothetical protein